MNAKLEYLLYRAEQLLAAGRENEAIEMWKEAGSLNPDDYHAWVNLMFNAEGIVRLDACKHVLRTTPCDENFRAYREFAERELFDAGLTVPREHGDRHDYPFNACPCPCRRGETLVAAVDHAARSLSRPGSNLFACAHRVLMPFVGRVFGANADQCAGERLEYAQRCPYITRAFMCDGRDRLSLL